MIVIGRQLNFLEPILAKIGIEITLNPTLPAVDDDNTIWFEWAEGNIIEASHKFKDYLKPKNVIVRLHAFEAYVGYHHKINWEVVNHLIVVSEHIKKKIENDIPKNVKIHVIPNAIDLEKWSYRQRTYGKEIAMVGNFQFEKGTLFIPHILAMLPKHKVHVVGQVRVNPYSRDGEYFYHLLDDLRVKNRLLFYPHQTNLDKWYEDIGINYILVASLAESFHVSTGEAMAKGIKPLIGNFKGAKQLWPVRCVYDSLKDIPTVLHNGYESEYYRNWVKERYDINLIVKQITSLIQ